MIFECPKCGRKVKGSNNLDRHMLVHDFAHSDVAVRLYTEGVSSAHSCVRGPRRGYGLTLGDIGLRLGMGKDKVRRAIVGNGFSPQTRVVAVRYANFTTRFTCPVCGKVVRGSNLQRHVDAHDGRYFTRCDERILKLYDSHFSMRKISEMLQREGFHISAHSVRKVLIANGVNRRNVFAYDLGRLSAREMDRTVYLYRDKELTQQEVGEILGITPSGVHHRLKRAGVLRTRKEADRIYSRRGKLKRKKDARIHISAASSYDARAEERSRSQDRRPSLPRPNH